MLATAEEPVAGHRVDGYPVGPAEIVPAPSEQSAAEQRRDLETATQALTFAGLLLAPERGDQRAPKLALLLLRESFIGATRALTGNDALDTVREARAALETRENLADSLRRLPGLTVCLELESQTLPERSELLQLETLVAELIRFAKRGGRPRPHRHFRIGAALILVAAAVVGVPYLWFAPSWWGFEWRASSAYDGFEKSGTLKQRHEDLVFHTASENEPWVLIDMKEQREISEIVIENRVDCCTERGLPLIVEVGNTPETLTLVDRKTKPFDEWTLTFAPREARYVRLRAEGTNYIHLHSVSIQ